MDTIPFVDNVELVRNLRPIFLQGAKPPSQKELASIGLLTPQSWPKIWKPDVVEEARVHWEELSFQAVEAGSKGPIQKACEKASKELDRLMNSPRTKQTAVLPHTFVRYLTQVNLRAYPYWRIQNCWWRDLPDELEEVRVTPNRFLAFAHRRRFAIVREWLRALPLDAHTRVYVAHYVEDTLAMGWQVFVNHWDSFAPLDALGAVNVVGDDPRWHLWFHHEGVAVFGCTLPFAREKGLALPATLGVREAFDDEMKVALYRKRELVLLDDPELLRYAEKWLGEEALYGERAEKFAEETLDLYLRDRKK